MADKMRFPERIDDFLMSYSFKDDKRIYTNGSRLIPTFRVEQALEHYGQKIRNNTIDEFYNKCGQKIFKNDMDLSMTDITYIARQMKEEELSKVLQYDRIKTIDNVADILTEMCKQYPITTSKENHKPLYAHSDGTWHDLIKDVVDMMKGDVE